MEALTSRRMSAVMFVSSSYRLIINRSSRPRTFQSRCRRSSPGPYSRCSTNSTLKPCRELRFMPLRKPSTTRRAVSSRREILANSSESKKLPGAGIVGLYLLAQTGEGRSEDETHQLVAADPLGLGAEVGDQAVAEGGKGHRPQVGPRHREAALEERARLAGEEQGLDGPGACAPRHPALHLLRRAGVVGPR